MKTTDNLYLDTSALIKIYIDEADSLMLRSKIVGHNLWIGQIGILEFYSAVFKKERTKSITKFEADLIIESFKFDIGKFKIIHLSSDVLQVSLKLIQKYRVDGLRTLDSLQIASALSNTEIGKIISYDNLFNKIVGLEIKKKKCRFIPFQN